jgi:hypothetical protein
MNTSPEELSENIPDRQAHSVIATAGVDPSNQKNLEIISVSHGDAELVLGWWGWYGGTSHVASVLEKAADAAISDPENCKFTFEYDGVTFEFYDKFYPTVTAKIRKAAALGAWEVVGGTYAEPLPYQISLESVIRQWVYGTRSIKEIVGQPVKTFHYQEFMLFPQLPIILSGVGIDKTVYENHLAISGRLHKNFRGAKWWIANEGSRILAISDSSGLFVDWPDLLHIKSSKFTLSEYLEKEAVNLLGSFNPSEKDFYFDAAGYTDSYGNLASINNCLVETRLLTAERFATIAYIQSGLDMLDQIEAAWKALLGSQTHGVMYCGSEAYCSEVGASTYEAARYLRQVSDQLAKDVLQKSLLSIAESADTRANFPGKALVIFNPLGFPASGYVEKQISFSEGEASSFNIIVNSLDVAFSAQKQLFYQDGSLKTSDIFFKVDDLPSLGYRTYHISFEKPGSSVIKNSSFLVDQTSRTVENAFLKVSFDANGCIASIFSKTQGVLLLGADDGSEAETAYDKTAAIRLRNTLGREDWYAPRGWEVVEETPIRVIVRSKYESNLANCSIYLTLYDELERLDIRVEWTAKDTQGDILTNSAGEKKERVWLDFIPAFPGSIKCDTIADVLNEPRSYYFSNTWINYTAEDLGFTILHKGIHAWDVGYCAQEPREKKERALSAQLGQTENSWIPGMLRINTKFAQDGIICQEFALLPLFSRDEYFLHKATQNYYFNFPVIEQDLHSGSDSEYSFMEVSSDNALITAFYANLSSGKKPAVRLWNPRNQSIVARCKVGFDIEEFQEVRLDGNALGFSCNNLRQIKLPPTGLKTFQLVGLTSIPSKKGNTGIGFTTLPCITLNGDFLFDAPLESYRLYTHYAEYRGENQKVYQITDPYVDLDMDLNEVSKQGDFRVWTGSITLPEEYDGCRVRLVLAWGTEKQGGIGSCLLTNNYLQRADEPISVFVNGNEVETFDFNLSSHVRFGIENSIRILVLAPEVPIEELRKRSSIIQYGVLDGQGVFGNLRSARLRIGRKINSENCQNIADCTLTNPGFESEDLFGWRKDGDVSVSNRDDKAGRNFHALLKPSSRLEQDITIRPGNYVLRVNAKSIGLPGSIGICISGAEASSTIPLEPENWTTVSLPFSVPEGIEVITLFSSAHGLQREGSILLDDFRVIANRVAKDFTHARL